MGCNTETNKTDTITNSNTITYPTYNKNDNAIAYTYEYPGRNTIFLIDLDPNKIAALAGGSDAGVEDSSQWPVFYANGVRSLPTAIKMAQGNSSNKASALIYPNPCIDKMMVTLQSTFSGIGTLKIYNIAGQVISITPITLSNGDNTIPVPLSSSIHEGCYLLLIETETESWAGRFVKN